MSDRLAVLDQGRVMQVGTPSEVYSQPESAHVATFLGSTNLWDAEVVSADDTGLCCRIQDVELRVAGATGRPGDRVSVMVRPERIDVSRHTGVPAGPNVMPGRIGIVTFRGARTTAVLDCRGLRVEAEVGNVGGMLPEWLYEGADVVVQVSPHALHVLPD